jgi:hypothetical protein
MQAVSANLEDARANLTRACDAAYQDSKVFEEIRKVSGRVGGVGV